ncbi:MAG: agmatine deiminase family protein [Pseudomonadota bacterium]
MSEPRLYVPPEWAPQEAVWVGWPHLRGEWGAAFQGARDEIAAFVRTLCKTTPTRIACGSREAYGSAWFALEGEISAGRVTLHTLPAGDIWLRDTGPIFALSDNARVAMDFQFNGWGGKYVMAGDTMTASGITSVEQAKRQTWPFILEGGAVDLDGAGRLLTTRQCMLNANRNPDWTLAIAEQTLKRAFGVNEIIWFGDGLANDHTDGHIDNIARFIGPGRVACHAPSGADDPNARVYEMIYADLLRAGLEVVEIPSPGRIEGEHGDVMPAGHLNFLISNNHIFMPTYEDQYAPAALAALERALPGHKILGLPARNILLGGGSFHCMTQQVPRLTEDDT